MRTRSQAQQQQPATAEQQHIAELQQNLQQQAQDMARLNSELDQAGAARVAAETEAQRLKAENSQAARLGE